MPPAPSVTADDGSGECEYALIAIGPQGSRSAASPSVRARGRATLAWDSVPGADAYLVIRDGKVAVEPLRIEGARKEWSERPVDR